jgi:Ca-activated chloride channel homolog
MRVKQTAGTTLRPGPFALIAVCALVFMGGRWLPVSSGGQKDAPASTQAIKVDVTLVTVPVTVTDREGNLIAGLRETDFHIFEDGVAQQIDRLVPAAEPFFVVLMLDRSGSTKFKYEDIQKAALTFVDALRPQDRFLVVSFDTEVTYHSGFTEDRGQLRPAILSTRSSGNRTRLYDALASVMRERLDPLPGRKALVLFSDGVDNDSSWTEASRTLAQIQKSDVLVYAIQYDTRMEGMSDPFHLPPPPGQVSFNSLYNAGTRYLRDLSSHSGGRLYPADTIAGLQEAFAQIAAELPRQYTLCYYPAKLGRAGSLHRLRVTVDRPGVKVRARTGYRVGP